MTQKELILSVHKEASEYLKAELERQFPDYFEPKIFEFNETFEITAWAITKPLFIGLELCPPQLKRKCLIVGDKYTLHTIKDKGRTIIYFTKEN